VQLGENHTVTDEWKQTWEYGDITSEYNRSGKEKIQKYVRITGLDGIRNIYLQDKISV
jgi:hypothetical protein